MNCEDSRSLHLVTTEPRVTAACACVDIMAGKADATVNSDETSTLIYKIFCEGGEGTILHAVQMNRVFPDSKTFVDLNLRREPGTVLEDFQSLLQTTSQPSTDQMVKFVEENFSMVKSLEDFDPEDWTDLTFNHIQNVKLREMCVDLNRRWKMLGRKTSCEKGKPNLSTLLHLPNPAVVPGGRFGEIYYWDTYWVLRGLYVSNMIHTARGMIENLIDLLNRIGYVPNGGRAYYTRSQPPLLASMVWDYYNKTGDLSWAAGQISHLQREWKYWEDHHAVVMRGRKLFRYKNVETSPRPESYREDYLLAADLSPQLKSQLYTELRSGAESGWDYSSRWFDEPGDQASTLSEIRIQSILPVDLNAFLYKSASIIADILALLGNKEQEETWRMKAEDLMQGMEELMWDDEMGTWFDLNINKGCKRKIFAASNLSPLWAGAFPVKDKEYRGRRSVEYLTNIGALNYKGGVPTTLRPSGQQWDFPNVWPPLEHMLITGLRMTGDDEAVDLARKLAEQTITRNVKVFHQTKHMYEKYDCRSLDKEGGGGEYSVQLGFGWTNGVTLDLVETYPSISIE